MKSSSKLFSALLLLSCADAVQASLIDRGGGLIYDDVLDVTWLQDANLAMTSGYDADGKMTWEQSKEWVAGLEYYDPVRDMTWSNWRLPETVSNIEWRNGFFDLGGEYSELAHMYYNNLGLDANYTLDPGSPTPVPSVENPFFNLAYLGQWFGTAFIGPDGDLMGAWGMHYHFGFVAVTSIYDSSYAWAVRDGDVASAVPEPSETLLLACGILALVYSRLRRRVAVAA